MVEIARRLLGKVLCSYIDGELTAVCITEVEAYGGIHDRASHAYGGRYTARTRTMYLTGGVSYVYLCYGMHYMFNVVTGPEGIPDAILVRAGIPIAGVEVMAKRRGVPPDDLRLTTGPGALTRALGITTRHNGIPLWSDVVWIEEPANPEEEKWDIGRAERVGVAYAGRDAERLWRFYIKGCEWVSKDLRSKRRVR